MAREEIDLTTPIPDTTPTRYGESAKTAFQKINAMTLELYTAIGAGSGGGPLISTNNLDDLDDLPTALANLGLDEVDNTSDVDKPVSTAQAQGLGTQYYGDTDPTTITGLTVGPGFVWAHATPELRKRRNDANDDWIVEGGLFDNPVNQNVLSLNGGPLAGFRNKIINGAFQINERGYASGSATTATEFTFDRWYVTGTAGITYATSNGKTTVTIPSGQTLKQVIEASNVPTGTYVLSWSGTAQGRVNGGSYGASGEVTVPISGGGNVTVEFNSGTLAEVQLEQGVIPTPFEYIDICTLQMQCLRYYEKFTFVGLSGATYSSNGDTRGPRYLFLVPKRATPSVTPSVVAVSVFAAGPNGAEPNLEGSLQITGVTNRGLYLDSMGNSVNMGSVLGGANVFVWGCRHDITMHAVAELT